MTRNHGSIRRRGKAAVATLAVAVVLTMASSLAGAAARVEAPSALASGDVKSLKVELYVEQMEFELKASDQ
jgi:hypothetical protein